jgi:hypothetical protein
VDSTELIQSLLNGCFWLFDDNASHWQLMIATDLVDKIGPRDTYLRLATDISKVAGSDFQRLRLTVISPEEPIYKELRKTFAASKNVPEERLQNTTLNGVAVADAYLYRIQYVAQSRAAWGKGRHFCLWALIT